MLSEDSAKRNILYSLNNQYMFHRYFQYVNNTRFFVLQSQNSE